MNFRNFFNKISYYFKDCYGIDKLTKYLFALSFILSFTRITAFLSFALIVYGIFRSISKNKYKRYQELAAFENLLLIIKQQYYSRKARIIEFRKYKILKCPNCSQKLRIPRKKGKVIVTCKKCGTEFKEKS